MAGGTIRIGTGTRGTPPATIYDNFVHDTSATGALAIASTGGLITAAAICTTWLISPVVAGFAGIISITATAGTAACYMNGNIDDKTIKAVPGKITQGLKKVNWNRVGQLYKKVAIAATPIMSLGAFVPMFYIPALGTAAILGLTGTGMVAGRYIATHF